MQGEQLPQREVDWSDLDGGARVVARAVARRGEDPLELARRLIELGPSGTRLARLEVDQRARGALVAVTFERLRRTSFAGITLALR